MDIKNAENKIIWNVKNSNFARFEVYFHGGEFPGKLISENVQTVLKLTEKNRIKCHYLEPNNAAWL